MHQITSLSGSNVYGTSFSYDLAPVTLITGLNTAGKTKLFNTVRLILNGYLPKLGATNQATFSASGLMTGPDEMFVMGAFKHRESGDLLRIDRTWKRDSKGKVSLKENVPAALNTPDVLLDFSIFLKMKSAERTAYVFERVSLPGSQNIGAILGERIGALRDKFPAKHGDPALSSILEDIDLEFIKAKKFGFKIQETLANIIKILTEKKKTLDQKVKQSSAVILSYRHEGPSPADHSVELAELVKEQKAAYDGWLLLNNQAKQPLPGEAEAMREVARCEGEYDSVAYFHAQDIESLRSLSTLKKCPHCQSSSKGWDNRLRETFETRLSESAKKKLICENAMAAAKSKLVEIRRNAPKSNQDELLRLQGRLSSLKEKQTLLSQKQALWNEYQRKRKEVERLRDESLADERASEVYGAAIKTVVGIQEEQLAGVFGKLLSVANRFTEGLIPHPLEYRNGEIGWMTPRGWVCNELFSGYQERLAFSGLQVALCQDAPCKIVMVDEMGTLDKERKRLFVQRMLDLVDRKVIDQCLMIDVSDIGYEQFLPHPFDDHQAGLIGHIAVEEA